MCNMAPKFSNTLLVLLLLLLIVQPFLGHSISLNLEWTSFKSLLNLKDIIIQKGQTVKGLKEIKQHLKNFGYYPNNQILNLSDIFDDQLESALKKYQQYYQLNVTGNLDSHTMLELDTPRCGVPDDPKYGKFQIVPNFAFFGGKPKWPPSKYHLTYQFTGIPDIVDINTLRDICSRCFKRWADVSHFTFGEALPDGVKPDIFIGFYRGAHGDGYPFDGHGKVFAHAFAPRAGLCHFDADDNWSTSSPIFAQQVDLESVVVHEIGHLLGLQHSAFRNAIMYPKISFGAIKRELTQDDIDGIHALYENYS